MKRFVVLVALTSLSAWADIPPPDVSGCNGKQVGDSCKRDDGTDANCVKSTCSRNDYSNGPPPTTVTYDCVTCTGSGAPPAEKKNACAVDPSGLALAALGLALLRRRRA